jgi:uncharacterized MAPEG superfamily protein
MLKALLAPAAVLILWSLVVLLWMAVSRFGGLGAVPKEKMRELPRVGGRGKDLEAVLPKKVNWVSHNYTHLMEQPTLFYAVIGILALLGQTQSINVNLAWGYVVLRIAHSLWQNLVNTIPVRFGLFILSTLCLIALGVSALRATLM